MMMKKITYTAFVILLLFAQISFAQVREEMKEMSLGHRNAFTIELPDAGDKLVAKIWKEYVKDFYGSKTKWNRKTKEWVSEGVKNRSLDEGHGVTFYANMVEKGDDVAFTLWIDQGSAFASSENSGDREAEKLLLRFALELAQENIRIELENEEGELDKLESEKKKLLRAEDKYKKEIERAQKRLEDNEKAQKQILKDIEAQLKKVEKVKKKLSDL